MEQLLATTTATYKTTISKGYYDKQWSAKTYIDINGEYQLRVSTFKGNRGLYTSCQAVKIQATGSTGFIGESFMLYQDYSKTIMLHPEVKRVTDKAISEAHNKALSTVETFVQEAKQFYSNKQVN